MPETRAIVAIPAQAQQAASGAVVAGASPSWHPLSVKAFIGVSGAYDLPALAEHLHKRGLYKELLAQVNDIRGCFAWLMAIWLVRLRR